MLRCYLTFNYLLVVNIYCLSIKLEVKVLTTAIKKGSVVMTVSHDVNKAYIVYIQVCVQS